ncbi:acyltransferase family protein [Sphingomonas nostoxanthinifaciens]|uniref:acyltransferase family protein n=1 Tax=Sphingomonas nostoxanthinifaciens TaxID=2872652 RepID=UPI001CC1E183|nr:acyltransferase [Sphingomonas nostoxanthinifaciens]UAK25775.1 acyltransferase [Sphingomonas nostoxanthinifaciens]
MLYNMLCKLTATSKSGPGGLRGGLPRNLRRPSGLTRFAPEPAQEGAVTRQGNKDKCVQALRGVAALLVVILHARNTLRLLHRPMGLIGVLVPDNSFGALGVDMFFVISGAVMGMALSHDLAPGRFLRARFRRVVPLFWLSAIVTIALSLLLREPLPIARLANSVTILPLFDFGAIALPMPPAGWTLAFELYFYMIVGTALCLPKPVRTDAVVAVLLLCALVGALSQPIAMPMLGIALNPMLLEFALGLVALQIARRPMVIRHAPLLVAVGMAPLLYSAFVGFSFSSAPEVAISGETSVARVFLWGLPSAMLLAGSIARPDRLRAANLWVRLGDASYAIYLTHWPVMMLLPKVWPWAGTAGSDMLCVTLIAAGTAAGFLAHLYVEQPLLARLRQKGSATELTSLLPA